MEFADSQASSTIEYDDGTIFTKCDLCREMWQERNSRGVDGSPPCDTCRVELMPDNEEAAKIYLMTRRQVITAGMEGRAIDIFIPSVESAMRVCKVIDQERCLMKVMKTFHHFMRAENEDS